MSPTLADALLAYAHFLFMFATVAVLAAELVLCRGALAPAQARRLAQVDQVYFVCAMGLLASGLARLFFGAKGTAFYVHNPVFHLKLSLFVLVGLLSIAPTLRFLRWRKRAGADPAVGVDALETARAARFVHAQLALVAAIPLLATLMARGLGN